MSRTRYTRTDSAAGSSAGGGRTVTPNQPIRTADLAADEWSEGVRFAGAEIPLSRLGGGRDIGVNLVTVPPGKQSCPMHYHVHEEEHFYILEGRVVLRTGDTRSTMEAGDYVCFPAGTGVGHCFENIFETPCRLLAIGARLDHEIAVYPESGKMKLRALGRIVAYASPDESLDYWAEERPDEVLETGERE